MEIPLVYKLLFIYSVYKETDIGLDIVWEIQLYPRNYSRKQWDINE